MSQDKATIEITVDDEGAINIELFGVEGTESAKAAATILSVWDAFQTSPEANGKEPNRIITLN